jgi:hypothetical protein
MDTTSSSDHSAIYHNLQLRLAIANDLSLAIGPSRIVQKEVLMQLGYQSNSYNLIVTPDFKAKTRCSLYVCPGSSCHTYGQNVNTENQCLYYINIII